jgi:hypothetical protein
VLNPPRVPGTTTAMATRFSFLNGHNQSRLVSVSASNRRQTRADRRLSRDSDKRVFVPTGRLVTVASTAGIYRRSLGRPRLAFGTFSYVEDGSPVLNPIFSTICSCIFFFATGREGSMSV